MVDILILVQNIVAVLERLVFFLFLLFRYHHFRELLYFEFPKAQSSFLVLSLLCVDPKCIVYYGLDLEGDEVSVSLTIFVITSQEKSDRTLSFLGLLSLHEIFDDTFLV